MLPPVGAVAVDEDGVVPVIVVAAGSVPATATIVNGIAVSPAGAIYVVMV